MIVMIDMMLIIINVLMITMVIIISILIIIIVKRWGWCQWTSIYGSDGPSQVR